MAINNINLDAIIRSSSTPEMAFENARIQAGGTLTTDERTNIVTRILNSNKFKGKFSGGSSGNSFTGGGGIGEGSSSSGGDSNDTSMFGKTLSTIGSGISAIGSAVNFVVKGVGKGTALSLESQMGKEGDNTAMDIAKSVGQKGFMSLLDAPGAMLDAVLDQLKQESQLLSEVNTKTGISGDLSEGLRDSMINASKEARKYGFELSNIGDFYTTLSEQSGKFALINKTTIVEASKTAAALGMSLTEMAGAIGDYEKVGLGAKETTKAIGDAAVRSISLGLNARKVSDGMKESVGKLNEFGFRNGIQGLERMVQKSIEFRVSMENVSTIAEKVLNPDGAVELAANLQVLGGAIGDFGDPIKMMYDATNNVEGLQDSLIGAAKGLATYNQQQGRFEITGINLRRAREMANALGISMGDLTKTAVAAQERVAASTALMSRGLKIEDKEKEFLTNLSRMEGGEMKIVVPESIAQKLGVPTELALDKLDQKTADALIKNQKEFEKMNPEKMAMSQLTATQQMARDVEVMASWAKIQAASYLRGAGEKGLKGEVDKIKSSIARTAEELKVDRKGAYEKGSGTVEAIKNVSLTDWESYKKMYNTIIDSNPFKTGEKVAQQPQEVKHTHTILSNPHADVFAEGARKNAAVGFSLRDTNPKEYT
jgi:hypothetical protein